MCYAKSCCYCLSLRSGCIAISLYSIFCSVLNIDFIILILTDYKVARIKYLFPVNDLNVMLQLLPEFLMIIAGILLFIYTLAHIAALLLLYVILASSLCLYVLAFSIVSTTMGSNMIVNESKMHLIAYWMYMAFSLVSMVYFMYIAVSYYKYNLDLSRS
ncbi:uncharacterized protein [Drosophila virilis]|uniref:Uncharacterized protein, isoform A n=2 Tax=Drosophila virilis TaxID=7244 RepID=A0A0Q9WWA9_DROVI|nr:uncharacterized protein LOC26530752 [Drosophila virilis]KRF85131.1 uncharacterized protein Dvir_GJ25982, isoform A [Drosophila virilis]